MGHPDNTAAAVICLVIVDSYAHATVQGSEDNCRDAVSLVYATVLHKPGKLTQDNYPISTYVHGSAQITDVPYSIWLFMYIPGIQTQVTGLVWQVLSLPTELSPGSRVPFFCFFGFF